MPGNPMGEGEPPLGLWMKGAAQTYGVGSNSRTRSPL